MILSNWTLSITLSRHNLILRFPLFLWPKWTTWWMTLFKKKISNIHLPPNSWMKNWEYIIHWALILLSPTPKFRIHLSMTSSEAQKAAGYELSWRLFYAWWLSVRFFWLMRRQISIQNALFVMIRLACGALFWTFTKIEKMGWNRRRTKRNEKKSFIFYVVSFSFFPATLWTFCSKL